MEVGRLSFLVVEDHAFQRDMVVRMLKSLHAKAVYAAADGRAALDVLKRLTAPVDVIVSDLDMPAMDGMEFMRHIGNSWKGTSLIVASGLERELLASVETMATAYGIQFLGALEKPVTPRKLEELIALHKGDRGRGVRPSAAAPSFSLEEIEEGLLNAEFEPFLQPKVHIETGRVIGAEALARWRHPQQGIVSPNAFVSTLEHSGRIDMLTRCMLGKSAEACHRLHAAGHESVVSVNVSATSLHDVTLADQITELIRSHNLEPRCLILEITESAATTNIGKSLENLTRLRMKGFGLAIDDYGTGYSSPEQLTRIPFTELKIDQAFVSHAGRRESAKVILASSLDMARRLGIRAVAEGVETRENWEMLCELKCDLAQGYYIAKPMAVDAYLKWLAEWPGITR